MQPLQNCIGPTIRISREILCLPYAGFLILIILKRKEKKGLLLIYCEINVLVIQSFCFLVFVTFIRKIDKITRM